MHSSISRRLRPAAFGLAPLICFAAVALAAPAQAAPAPGAHAHGVAELRVVVDGGRLEVALESPLDNLVGFEHAPRTDKQRAAVRSMAAKLRQAQTLFVPTAAARCSLGSVRLASSALPAELLGEKEPTAPQAGQEADGHADLDASFVFDCAAPAELKGMDVGLLSAFRGFHKLNVQVVGPKGQSATVLTPRKRSVSW